jgi:glycosyltransferase involved in cell wall biosynthesis
MTILQMHLTRNLPKAAVEVEQVGLGRILWIPVPFRQKGSRLVDWPNRIGSVHQMSRLRAEQEHRGAASALSTSVFHLLRNRAGHLRSRTAVLSDGLEDLLAWHHVTLLALHWLSYDTDILIRRAIQAKVPFVLINHFDNDRLSSKAMRRWVPQAAAVGTVSDKNVPAEVQGRYMNLSDAVDIDFFDPARVPESESSPPIVFLPARIDFGKGHEDLMRAGRILHERNIACRICFAGAVDAPSLQTQLRQFAAESGMANKIEFLGEMTAPELRQWYVNSSMVVLPSYSEGLGRVLLEAQSMEKPVIAYRAGGTGEAVVEGETGMLVTPGDIKGLADQMELLLSNPEQRRKMGRQGREFVSRTFSVSDLIRRHETFYFRALSRAIG